MKILSERVPICEFGERGTAVKYIEVDFIVNDQTIYYTNAAGRP